jgi:hypothetical protein
MGNDQVFTPNLLMPNRSGVPGTQAGRAAMLAEDTPSMITVAEVWTGVGSAGPAIMPLFAAIR